ncbi:PRDX2_4 [Lepeophtheirus salmonis]|uniref:thioredoxin-dependent peroxiredoxin n=1 Tax=Lepeophtheirus salmonis TaxID=72036 RepID=A0A7R8HD58_LEPSM|nr:PRDX2_4 [Lepeophtheirus salmonis]CAF3003944.1 PRDX2_4 [Lepeophtheirus salmonis]
MIIRENIYSPKIDCLLPASMLRVVQCIPMIRLEAIIFNGQKAMISKPAPFWKGSAVVKGEMKEISLLLWPALWILTLHIWLGPTCLDYGVYLEENGHTLRGLFIIDGKGILRQITMNDLPVGRSVDETLRLVQAFQYTDSHGEVCPCGWKPGSDTIIPDPKEKMKYFKNHAFYIFVGTWLAWRHKE